MVSEVEPGRNRTRRYSYEHGTVSGDTYVDVLGGIEPS